jgi:transcriptional regulator with XRE-family HTH domain
MARKGSWPPTGFAQRLQRLRHEAGMTQQSLAAKVGIDIMTISRMEREQFEPTWPMVLALARALETTPDSFMPEDGVYDGRPKPRPKRDQSKKS